jgi:hypothetical protein
MTSEEDETRGGAEGAQRGLSAHRDEQDELDTACKARPGASAPSSAACAARGGEPV